MTHTCAELSQMIFEAWNNKRPEDLLPLYAESYIEHTSPPGTPDGLDWVKMQYEIFSSAFPDIHFVVEDLVESGDKVATRLSITGTHDGELMGIPATGRTVDITGMGIHRAEGGKCVEAWFMLDEMSMMRQLGLIPT